jgi:ADP-ribose pyrophosphatase YjhB (NUDIX family)
MNNHAYFQIAAKAIVKKDNKILLLKTKDNHYDFPGGRMDESEVDLSLHEVLKRELKEELGQDFTFDIKEIAFVSKRKYDKDNKENRIIAIFFQVDYISGDILLSDEHERSEWINPKDIIGDPDKFISEDEYEQYCSYVKNNN